MCENIKGGYLLWPCSSGYKSNRRIV